MTPRTRMLLLLIIAVGWVFLAGVNFAKGHPGVGALYLVPAVASGAIALAVKNGRRAR